MGGVNLDVLLSSRLWLTLGGRGILGWEDSGL